MEIRSLDQQDKCSICSWQYPEPYGIYNLPSWDEMQRQGIGFAHPQKARNFYGFWEDNALIGFVNLMEEDAEVFVGIGVEPSRCGQHKGSSILRQAVQMAIAFTRARNRIWRCAPGTSGPSAVIKGRGSRSTVSRFSRLPGPEQESFTG